MEKTENNLNKKVQFNINQIVVFKLDELLYALSINSVIYVFNAVNITHLPKSPDIISGIINVKGQIIPVVDLRKRFGLISRELIPDDHLIMVDTGKRKIALWVDTVIGIKEIAPEQYVEINETFPFIVHIKGVAKIEDGLIFIYDIEQCLNLNEEIELEQALLIKK